MNKNIDDVRSFWDSNPLLAGEIDAPLASREWFEELDRIKTHECLGGSLADWIPDNIEGKRVLDVGCGPGYWNRQLSKQNVDYFGIDISPKTVEIARTSKSIFNCKGSIEVGNAEKLDFPSNHFDLVVSEGVIHHTPDTQACIDEIYRILKPGGRANIGVYYKTLLLRSKPLFKLSQFGMRVFSISLKGRGRKGMDSVNNPQEFVRMYDGRDNPIGKAYVKKDLRNMFQQFRDIHFRRYYFPSRSMGLNLPVNLQRLANSQLGLMILIQAQK